MEAFSFFKKHEPTRRPLVKRFCLRRWSWRYQTLVVIEPRCSSRLAPEDLNPLEQHQSRTSKRGQVTFSSFEKSQGNYAIFISSKMHSFSKQVRLGLVVVSSLPINSLVELSLPFVLVECSNLLHVHVKIHRDLKRKISNLTFLCEAVRIWV